MSTPSPSPTKQARPTSSLPLSASREKIRAESATGWSPLRIPNKPGRDSPAQQPSASHQDNTLSSPLAKHTTTTTTTTTTNQSLTPHAAEPEETYRRSSSSYKHLKTNSLVSNSPFKSTVDNTPPPPLPPLTKRSATAAKKAALGLGISSSPASSPRAPPTQRMQGGGGGTTVGSGGVSSSLLPRASPRRSSADRRKNEENLDPTLMGEPAVVVVVPGGTTDEDEGERGGEEGGQVGGGGLSSGEEEPNAAAIEKQRKAALFKKDAKRRQSAGLAGLSSKSKVSNSPFLTRSSSSEMEDSNIPAVAPPTPSPLVQSTSDDQLARDDNEDDQSQSQYDDEEEEEEAQEPQHPALFHPSPLESLSSTLSSSQPSSPSSSVLSAPSPPPPAPAQAAPSTPPRPHGHLRQNLPVSPSPGRSSLRSRRIRGPRDSAGSGSGSGGIAGSGSRPRRKTVTFQEGAEVSVFERGEGEDMTTDSGSGSNDDEYGVASASDEDENENYGEEGSFDLDHHHQQHQQGGYSDDEDEQDSSFTHYHPSREETQSATESFVSSLLEEDLFSPSSVTSPVFQSGMMGGGMGIPPSPILVQDPSPTTTTNTPTSFAHDQPHPHHHQHHHTSTHPTPPQSELPHPGLNEHEIGMNEEVEVEEREGEVKVHQEGPLHDPFLPPSTTPMKKMGAGGMLGLGRPSGEVQVPRRRVAEPEPEEEEEEEEEGEVSMLDEGDSNVLEEMESMGLGEEEDEMVVVEQEEGDSVLEEEQEERETSMVEEEGNSFWEEEKTSEEVALVAEEVAEHPLMGSRGLRLDAVEQVEVVERPSTPPPTFLAAPVAAADSPWKLPSLAASTSPLFNMKDLPETSPAVPQQPAFATTATLPPITTAQFQTSNSEQSLASSAAGEFGSYKPSSSLERLRAEDGEEGAGGSASGRSPRLTKESIRRRMDERKEKEKVEREREMSKGKQQQQHQPSNSEPWRPIEGLGIAMPSTSPVKARPTSTRALSSTREEEHRPTSRPSSPEKAHLNKELPAPPPRPTSQLMSRPKAATTDVLPASVRTQSSIDLDRPALAGRSRSSTLSARDLLASESALDRLALGAVATAAPAPNIRGTEVVRNNGSEKEVKLNKKSIDLERPSSSPIEEAPAFQLGGAQHGRAPIPSKLLSGRGGDENSSSRREKERALMPPPPVPAWTKRSTSPTPSDASSTGGTREREEAIVAKRREKREEQGVGRPKGRGRRSLSTGDASVEGLQSAAAAAANSSKRRTLHEAGSRPQSTLDDVSIGANLTPFENDLTNEFDRITDHRNRQYKLNEREQVYIASDEKVSHDKKAGDLDRGKAWRSVKRPSDMNEYAEEIREIRAREKPGKSHAKVFVKIIGITDIDVPIPESTTTFQIVLNNGLHSVETQAYKFGKQVEIGQEFELLGLDNLEFSLAIKVRKDQHINSRLRSLTPRPGPAPSIIAPSLAPSTPTKTSAFRKLLSSPRKPKPTNTPSPVVARPVAPEPIKDDLVRYLASDGQLAIVKVIFKEISSKCNGQILNLHLPLTGRWNNDAVNSDAAARSPESAKKPRTIGRMQLQILMIDQIPGVPSDKLPQSLDDAVTGLRHVRWHKMDYFSGSLTQLGGDCSSWRRRQMRIVGGTLEATSDVTNKITARIDLSKMVEIRDDNADTSTRDHDRPMSMERSFRLVFDDGEEIQFFADKDKDKEDWLHHLRELLGRVPSLPLWAELLWVRQHQEQSPAL